MCSGWPDQSDQEILQQHGTVFWKIGGEQKLTGLKGKQTFKDSLEGVGTILSVEIPRFQAFSVENSPIWMDSSTTKQCQQMEKSVGGAGVSYFGHFFTRFHRKWRK